uniref:NADH-ubiquinone oxidoreductase chain 1 n=1 Tax=Myosotella myosotis TaxID=252580 RepID=G8HMV5_9EUPU|nr:NADH dehydrogenase subunit 1 [Myosotella myosotis]
MLTLLLSSISTSLCILVGVAFYTLLERKVLGYSQIRKGPYRVGVGGLPQPFADALKLLAKEPVLPLSANLILFHLAALLSLTIALLLWYLCPSFYQTALVWSGLLLFFCISSLNVYATLMAGWASNSKYAFLGALRAAAQTISYEVSMLVLLLFPSYLLLTYSWEEALKGFPVVSLLFPLTLIWFVSTLAETNRAPFDFAEGESEIVSGFNIEYSGGLFVLLFLGEYTVILFMSMSTAVWFLWGNSCWLLAFFTLLISGLFLLARTSFPRYRYDLLMGLCWKCFLPFGLSALMLSTCATIL